MNGWICLHRCLLNKPIWKKSTPEQRSVLITLLLMANHEPSEWEWMGEKFSVNPGQFVTSLDSIKDMSGNGISIQNVRSALARFEKLEFLTNKSTKTGRLISITNWDTYQSFDENTQQSNQQTGNKEVTTNNNDNNKEYIVEIVNYLNHKTGKKFNAKTKATVNHIKARMKEGHTLEDFKKVIDIKVAKWGTNPEMMDYLRPETLFGTKFESYLNETSTSPSEGFGKGWI